MELVTAMHGLPRPLNLLDCFVLAHGETRFGDMTQPSDSQDAPGVSSFLLRLLISSKVHVPLISARVATGRKRMNVTTMHV
jgi:hypothetical protein